MIGPNTEWGERAGCCCITEFSI